MYFAPIEALTYEFSYKRLRYYPESVIAFSSLAFTLFAVVIGTNLI